MREPSWKQRDTVVMDTFARRATSDIVVLMVFLPTKIDQRFKYTEPVLSFQPVCIESSDLKMSAQYSVQKQCRHEYCALGLFLHFIEQYPVISLSGDLAVYNAEILPVII